MDSSAPSKKREQEKRALCTAFPLLEKLYGIIEIQSDQRDSPDFAINVKHPNKHWGRKCQSFNVGIEVTTIDSAEILAYFNDEKHSKKEEIAQIENLSSGKYIHQPLKRIVVNIEECFLSSPLLKKAKKYDNYSKSGAFREIIIICFSEYLKKSQLNGDKGSLKEWTNFILHENSFPFDKVLFVELGDSKSSLVVYDKVKGRNQQPAGFQTITLDVSRSGYLPFNKPLNADEVLWGKPVIEPKKPKKNG
jgi:hypothetical protein